MIQINENDDDNEESNAMVYYMKRATEIVEMRSGTEHPAVAECFCRIGLIY